MAAGGREGRAERLNERLRGAQRANVEESFSLDLDGLDIPGSTSPAADENTTSSSSNGAHPYSDAISAVLHTPGSSARRRSRRLGRRDPYDLRETSKESSSPPPNGHGNENGHEYENKNENENEATPMPMDRDDDDDDDDATPREVTTAKPGTRVSTIARSAISRRLDPVPDELETLPTPAYVRTPFEVTSPPGGRMSEDAMIEEVAESPAHAPGSGKRRLALPANGETGYTARNLGAISSDRSVPASSSPSERRARRGDSFSMRGSVMSVSRLDLLPEVDEAGNREPSPKGAQEMQPLEDAEPERRQNGEASQHAVPDTEGEEFATAQEDAQPGEASELTSEAGPDRHLERELERELELELELELESRPGPEQQAAIEEHGDKAEENAKDKQHEKQQKENQSNGKQDDSAPADQQEAAPTETGGTTEAPSISKKKRGRPPRQKSPELGSVSAEEEPQEEAEQPTPKRRRPNNDRASRRQPAVIQRPAKPRSKPEPPPQVQEDENDGSGEEEEEAQAKKTKPRRRRRARDADEDGEEGGDGTIEVTVQRFVHHKRPGGGGGVGDDDDGEDPLHTEIPFANRGGESVVDALAQVCDEIITSTLAQFRETAADATSDAAKKKECRIKMRAIEAFREELNSRLLSHVIHLNHWHSLRRRLRHLQKEKMALRTGILSIRSEREQVALRMDAIRIKHEADTKESKYCLDASTLMHDIDLAVEQGRDAPEVSGKQQREAELANLELLVSRISQEASSAHATGGLLKQVQDFNAFLERAAIALETR